MITNGTVPALSLAERLAVLEARRLAVLREIEGLVIDQRVQKRLGAESQVFSQIAEQLRRCELALDELEVIRREWEAESG